MLSTEADRINSACAETPQEPTALVSLSEVLVYAAHLRLFQLARSRNFGFALELRLRNA